MIVFPNAKINIGLNILRKRKDGYHDLQTIFYPIDLKDALEVVVSEEVKDFEFFSSGIAIDAPVEKNLVIKAYQLMKKHFDIPGIKIHLHKNIPFGAGLGGGSADAAFMIKLLNDMFGFGLSREDMKKFASQLGADCAFFIDNKPAFATGIGDKLTVIDDFLTGYEIKIIKPKVAINSAGIYKEIVPNENVKDLRKLIELPISEWKNKIFNDFEKVVFKRYPEIANIKHKFYDEGAIFSLMTGTGSTVYGIFEKDKNIFI
jgi:4-diphosphocytidyl-2-C-methyl-D-erythritol kinase